MIFAFVEKQYGSDAATEVSRGSEYVRNVDPKNDPFAQFAG